MALNKKPVTGMKDIMPDEMQIRDYVINVIKETYGKFGFTPMETPCMENIENLSSKQGGENEKLIFKILKRGEKLNLETARSESDVVDFGMRYDLTVPLVRYYANHANELPSPFKALQMGNVWRADKPQKGRYRQFMQCDIDILGEESNLAEIELILATTTTLGRLGFRNFQIRINDRRLLKAMAAYSGFDEKDYDDVFITLDKMDKIGVEGVERELTANGYDSVSVEKYLALFRDMNASEDTLSFIEEKMTGFLDEDVKAGFREIIESVNATKDDCFRLVFDPTLVRGMSYYTGTIFEIMMPELGISCGGGGRYDKMVGRFTGKDVPACGFSIGFERIILILMESGFKVPNQNKKIVYLIEKGVSGDRLCEIIAEAQRERQDGTQVLVARMNKNKKFQKEQLAAEGYEEFKQITQYTSYLKKKNKRKKKALALEIIARLKKEYPESGCTLDYNEAWKLLVSVRLAAQCTDARVNVVVQGLYEKYPTIEAIAEADVEDIERIVKPCGLGHSKARDISACMKELRDTYDCKVPDNFEALLKLPGVGRKSANLIMGDVFGKPAIVTDTHCIRLTNRMGLVDNIKEPKKVEMILWELIPPEEGNSFCHRLVDHGREICTARTKPYCEKCCLYDICKKNI